MYYIYKNRDQQEIKFEDIGNNTVKMSEYSSSFMRTGEADITELEKKNNPNRMMDIVWVDVPGGPFISAGFDLNSFLMSHSDFLKQDQRKIVTKIEPKGTEVFFTYVLKPVPSHPNNKKQDVKKNSTF